MHIALSARPLDDLIEQASTNAFMVHRLMQLTEPKHFWPYLAVMFFRPAAGGGAAEGVGAAGAWPGTATAPPADLEPYDSGYTLATIGELCAQWPADDRAAFEDWLKGPGFALLMQDCEEAATAAKEGLRSNVQSLPGLMAAFWRMGAHPLQEDPDDETKVPDRKPGER